MTEIDREESGIERQLELPQLMIDLRSDVGFFLLVFVFVSRTFLDSSNWQTDFPETCPGQENLRVGCHTAWRRQSKKK